MDETAPQNQTALRRPIRYLPQQQQEERRERIKVWMGAALVITALCIDLFEALLDLVGIGLVMSPIISICADLLFLIWFWMLGLGFIRNPKNFAAMGIQAIIGLIPGLDILPELTLAILVIVLITRAEDKGGLLGKVAGIAQSKGLQGAETPNAKRLFASRLVMAHSSTQEDMRSIANKLPQSRFRNALNLKESGFAQYNRKSIELEREKSSDDGSSRNNVLDLKSVNIKTTPARQEKMENENSNQTSLPIPPITEEAPEEYSNRLRNGLTDYYIEHNPEINTQHPLVKKAYYAKYAAQAEKSFFDSSEMRQGLLKTLTGLKSSDDLRQSKEKDNKVLETLERKINNSSRESASGDNLEKIEYYANTNQTRDFFESGRKRDSFAYSEMMFGLPPVFLKTPEGKDYSHQLLDNKSIFLFGGGDSIRDLLTSDEYRPKSVINFDPYLKSESVEKNKNKIYRSEAISAADPAISEKVKTAEIPKADEIWATYSVPFYLDTPDEIKSLIKNITHSLDEGGNARISPISLQNSETENVNFEMRKKALQESLKEITDSGDFNLTTFGDTIKIHKIKKQPK